MNLKKALLIIFLLTTGLLNAQTNFLPGYVITTKGDTLFGKIDYRGDKLMGTVCNYKINDKDKETSYSPNDISAYRFIDSKYFVSKEVNGKKVFLEYLINGKINIYYQRDEQGDHYYLDKDNSRIIEMPFEEGIKYKDETPYLYKSTKHIGILKAAMQDAPKLIKRIEKLEKPDHRKLVKLAEDYHNSVCKDESCIIYEKKVPIFKISFEPALGIAHSQAKAYGEGFNPETGMNYFDKNYYQAGILFQSWIPRVSEKIFFRSGIIYTQMEASKQVKKYFYYGNILVYTLSTINTTVSVLKVPFQLEYIYPKGIIRPKAAIGFNLYFPFSQTYSFMGGADIKLSKIFSLSLNYDLDYGGFLFIPYMMASQSLLLGAKINF
jgi:hypothetical protein